MKKVWAIFLMAICLLSFVTGCSQSNDANDSNGGEKCLQHAGDLVCVNCGLNYYDELKLLITSNGRQGGTAGSIVYDGEKNGNVSTYVIYDASDSDIVISVENNLVGLGTQNFLITIPHPSNGDAIKDCKYTWIFAAAGNDVTSIGLLNAKTFSTYTSSLNETVYNGNSAVIDSNRRLCATYAKDGINYALIPLLKLGTKGLTVANFGFINF
ncbi:MAG: hypothetical protein IJW47_00735 [Clostridia bacterium]|nr:hypothetical protein [Clostridia bacterium]